MNNISIALGKRQLVDSIWKSAGIEGLGTTFSNTECILENLPVQTTREGVIIRDPERINGMEDKLESALEMLFK